ncbi:MAG: pyridoxal-phosphate dependent enzyme [Anaerolineae bacterium]|nr:pyridoxal-phosphate dependent enzyme [Thermoflexales bacterium]MDW8407978.1 pyridoxal-phosphate dependent enzyme [Anaerolineae bacterium]
MKEKPQIEDVKKAKEQIKGYIHRTPVMTSQTLNKMTGRKLFFKCENFQKTSSFKIRGATNAVLSLSQTEASRGVATHSSGNHAAALAQAARWRNIPAYVVMPNTAPQVKQAAVAGYGAQITFCEPTLAAREAGLREVIACTGATEIHPYDDYRVIAGQGTAALELLENNPDLDTVLTPVGGGGLLSGTAIVATAMLPHIQVIGVEPQAADDAYRSLQAGHRIEAGPTNTVADGLRTSLGYKTFPIIQHLVSEIITVSEEEIVQAMRFVWERMKIIIEASSAVPVAALLSGRLHTSRRRVGVILSGGNVDLKQLPWM